MSVVRFSHTCEKRKQVPSFSSGLLEGGSKHILRIINLYIFIQKKRSTPYAGLYATTKWALRGISETLHDEISPLGLRSICIDFGNFRTSFLESEHRAPEVARIDDYKEISAKIEAGMQGPSTMISAVSLNSTDS